ncbi:hypothetical protein [Cesiribacter andamanensis]|nr:hypothetical protein [Cesiribacter andamanensis]
MINTNRWNRIRYTLYTPVYDRIGRLFRTPGARLLPCCRWRPAVGCCW